MARPGYHSHLPSGPGSGSVQIETIAGYARSPEWQILFLFARQRAPDIVCGLSIGGVSLHAGS